MVAANYEEQPGGDEVCLDNEDRIWTGCVRGNPRFPWRDQIRIKHRNGKFCGSESVHCGGSWIIAEIFND